MNDLGVDFGTSNTVAALTADNAPARALAIHGYQWMPSAICLDEDGRLAVGMEAERLGRHLPDRFEPNPKRRIDEGDLLLGLKLVPVVEALTAVLTQVRDEARRQLGGRLPDHVCLTHPAQWGPVRQQSLRIAAQNAGLAENAIDVRLVAEPVAAATHYLSRAGRKLAPGKVLAVYDLGGGTFDCALVGGVSGHGSRVGLDTNTDPSTNASTDGNAGESSEGLTVWASGGLPDLGGVDFDQLILDHLGRSLEHSDADRWRGLMEARTAGDRRALRALRSDARAAKELLSQTAQVDIPLPDPLADALLTRREFERLVRPAIERTVDILEQTLASVGITTDALAGIYLVGGSSRIPLIAKVISDRLRIIPIAFDQPETVVALGAALLAATGLPDLTTSRPVRPVESLEPVPAGVPMPQSPEAVAHQEPTVPAPAPAVSPVASTTSDAAGSDNNSAAAVALLNLADKLRETTIDGAAQAYRTVIETGHPDHGPRAAVSLGTLLRDSDFHGARAALQQAIDSNHPYYGPKAADELGALLQPYDPASASRAYRQAIDSGHPDVGPEAAIHLGAMLSQLDPGGAAAAYRLAINSDHRELAPRAAFELGTMMSNTDRLGAVAAYQLAVDTGHPDWAPLANFQQAVLQQQVDRGAAEQAYRRVMASGHTEYAPMAATELALLLWISDPDAAGDAFATAVGSGHPQYAPLAAVHRGNLLASKDPAAAAEAYRTAVASGHPEHGPLAATNLGLLLQVSDPVGAAQAFQIAIDSRHANVGPMAAYHLGALLRSTDPDRATQLYRYVVDSSHPTFGPMARRDLSSLPPSRRRRPSPDAPTQTPPPA